jgi:regulator of sigma D
MGFLSRLIGSDERHNEIAVQPASTKLATDGGGIRYDAQLVSRLKEDHQELVRIYAAIKSAARAGHFNELPALLTKLKLDFQTHIMLENVKFYVYVQQHCAQDTETSVFISDVRKEMDDIARTVVKFVKTYASANLGQDTIMAFNAELEQIGTVLLQRVALEETRLYALYQPKYH